MFRKDAYCIRACGGIAAGFKEEGFPPKAYLAEDEVLLRIMKEGRGFAVDTDLARGVAARIQHDPVFKAFRALKQQGACAGSGVPRFRKTFPAP